MKSHVLFTSVVTITIYSTLDEVKMSPVTGLLGTCPTHVFWLSFLQDLTLSIRSLWNRVYLLSESNTAPVPFLLSFSNDTKMVSSKSVCIAVHLRFTICVCECTSSVLRNTVQITDLFSLYADITFYKCFQHCVKGPSIWLNVLIQC